MVAVPDAVAFQRFVLPQQCVLFHADEELLSGGHIHVAGKLLHRFGDERGNASDLQVLGDQNIKLPGNRRHGKCDQ